MRRRLHLIAVGAVVLLPVVGVGAATPPPFTNPPLPDGSVFDPRRIPSVPEAESALEAARAAWSAVTERVVASDAERGLLRERLGRLQIEDRVVTERVEAARRRLRVHAIETYVAGGPISTLEYFADTSSAADMTWRRFMLRASFASTRQVAHAYQQSSEDVDRDLVELALALDRVEAQAAAARAEVPLAEAAVAEAELALSVARHEADHRAGRIVVRSGDDGAPVPDESGNASGPAWELLRRCESGGNYAIADRTGWFRGAYQFAVSTWHGLGGAGDPADAPPAEQDYRAQILYDARGAQPWPVCGRFLVEQPPVRSDPLPGILDGLNPDEPLAGPGITTPSTSTSTTSTTSVAPTTASTDGPAGAAPPHR